MSQHKRTRSAKGAESKSAAPNRDAGSNGVSVDETLDVRGVGCPEPLLELIKTIRRTRVGTVIEVLTSDKASVMGIPMWVAKVRHELIEMNSYENYTRIVIRKSR